MLCVAASYSSAQTCGPLLVNSTYNEERLDLFHERVLAPTVISIAETMIAAEKAHFEMSNALAADEKQTADVRKANLGKVGRVRAAIGTLEALHAQPTQAFWSGCLSLHFWDVHGVLDATAKFTERPERDVKDRGRSSLTRAFGA